MQEDLFTKQRLTKDILVSELKRYYRWSLIPHLYVSVFCLAGDALLWTVCWPITEIYVLLCLLIVTGIFLAADQRCRHSAIPLFHQPQNIPHSHG